MKGDTLLYLILTNKEGLVRDKAAEVSLGCNDHEMELAIPRDGHKKNSRITTWDFRREDYNLFRDLLGKKSWDMALERRGVQDSRLILRITSSKLKNDPCQ